MKFSIMTSPRNYDVTYFFLPILMKIAQQKYYVKLEIKGILFVIFFFAICIEKIMIYYENHV